MQRSEIEIMAPAGSFDTLAAALRSGADSVYFGVGALNMRARSAANFTEDDLRRIVASARRYGARTYLTVNTALYDEELGAMHRLMERARAERVDAVIVSDQAAIAYARQVGLEVHLSTQLNLSNTESLRFYSHWADVAVLARELSLEQVGKIAETIRRDGITGPSGRPIRLELFAHGALCMAVSGKCYLSLHDNGCSANRGACRQICRRSYTLRDRDSGAELVAEGRYLLSPKDLCTIGFLDRVLAAGVRVLKIEGRARSAEYVARTVACYDEAVRAVCDGTYTFRRIADWTARLEGVFNRGFWDGYYLGRPVVELSPGYGSAATEKKVYVGKVINYYRKISVAQLSVEAAPLERGNRYVVIGPTTGALEGTADELYVADRPAEAALQGGDCSLRMPAVVRRGDRLYKLVPASQVPSQE